MSVVNAELSRAVVCYTQRGVSNWPQASSSAVLAEFGEERGAALLAEVTELFREANKVPVDWSAMDLNQATDHVVAVMGERHPELSPDALKALDWKYSFDWR